jgi:hypothetical protein
MLGYPVVVKLLCVALVVAVVFPLGYVFYPSATALIGELQFEAVEAIFSATVGFGIYALLFG